VDVNFEVADRFIYFILIWKTCVRLILDLVDVEACMSSCEKKKIAEILLFSSLIFVYLMKCSNKFFIESQSALIRCNDHSYIVWSAYPWITVSIINLIDLMQNQNIFQLFPHLYCRMDPKTQKKWYINSICLICLIENNLVNLIYILLFQ